MFCSGWPIRPSFIAAVVRVCGIDAIVFHAELNYKVHNQAVQNHGPCLLILSPQQRIQSAETLQQLPPPRQFHVYTDHWTGQREDPSCLYQLQIVKIYEWPIQEEDHKLEVSQAHRNGRSILIPRTPCYRHCLTARLFYIFLQAYNCMTLTSWNRGSTSKQSSLDGFSLSFS